MASPCGHKLIQRDIHIILSIFSQDLKKELESENSGDFKEVLSALCMGAAEYDAYEIHKAIKVGSH